jgi:acyl-CoA synthetase (AMP-forming)/AMP-acid ligase II
VRGPIVIRSYFNNAAADASSFDADGFYKTGDIGYCDAATKKWYIMDRKKELIKVRGFQVVPPELEAVLLSHPLIADAAVIGVSVAATSDVEVEEERPRAYIVKKPGPEAAKLSEKDVKEFCGKRLASYKELTGGVVCVDAIPKNASGKILKKLLREMAKKELEDKGEAKARL